MVAPAPPIKTVLAKRTYDQVPVTFDWHDYLANQRNPGREVDLNYVWRPLRALASGVQYRCTTEGMCSPLDTADILWPRIVGTLTDDGTAQWTTELLSNVSFRGLIQSYIYAVDSGVTNQDGGNNDSVYTVFVGGGTSGTSYKIRHQITLADPTSAALTGEIKEAVAILPVQD